MIKSFKEQTPSNNLIIYSYAKQTSTQKFIFSGNCEVSVKCKIGNKLLTINFNLYGLRREIFGVNIFNKTTTSYNTNPHLLILIRADCLA